MEIFPPCPEQVCPYCILLPGRAVLSQFGLRQEVLTGPARETLEDFIHLQAQRERLQGHPSPVAISNRLLSCHPDEALDCPSPGLRLLHKTQSPARVSRICRCACTED